MAKLWTAIVGSIDTSRPDLELEHADKAGPVLRQIGRALAEQGFGIVVYSSDPGFIEPLVVAGYIESGKAAEQSIRVIYPRHLPRPQFAEEQTHESCFQFRIDQSNQWEVSFYRSLYEADALFLLGGGQSTFIAGIIASVRRMPIIALDAYGGSARKVWELLNPFECPSLKQEDKNRMAESSASAAWAREMVGVLLAQKERLAEASRQSEVAKKQRDSQLQFQAFAGVGLLVLALLLFVTTWDAELDRLRLLAALIAAPALAGAAASTVRSLWEQVVGEVVTPARPALIMALLGCAAGILAGLLYVVAQLAALAPAQAGASMPKVASRLVPFALLTGFLAGFATDAFFRKMRDRDVGPIEVPGFPSK